VLFFICAILFVVMSYIDIGIVIIVGGFTLAGFWFGLIHMVGSLLGTVLGVVAAGRYFEVAASFAQSHLGGSLNIWRVVMFTIIYVLVNRLLGLVISLINHVFSFLSFIPFAKTFGRLFGAVFGFIEGVFVVALAIYLAARFPFGNYFVEQMQQSQFAIPFNAVGMILEPFLPEAVKILKSVL